MLYFILTCLFVYYIFGIYLLCKVVLSEGENIYLGMFLSFFIWAVIWPLCLASFLQEKVEFDRVLFKSEKTKKNEELNKSIEDLESFIEECEKGSKNLEASQEVIEKWRFSNRNKKDPIIISGGG